MRVAWAGYYADRALLLLSFVWLVQRWDRHQMIAARPDALYEPMTWLGALAFPAPIATAVWLGLAAAMALGLGLCLWRPHLLSARLAVAVCAALLMASEFGFGKIEHVNHLFLLAHLYALFLPAGRPREETAERAAQAEATRWYQSGLLFLYTMAGLWKFFDMTLRAVLKPGMTWLHPDAMPAYTALSYRGHDLDLAIPELAYTFRWLFPVGYVAMAFLLAPAALAPFRRPLLALVLPAIAVFHVMNALTVYALFLSTILVVVVLFFPYDAVVPAIRRRLTRPAATSFAGRGHDATYTRRYATGDEDVFLGFYAYRARLEDRAWMLAAPLYYPGVAALAGWWLRRAARQPQRA